MTDPTLTPDGLAVRFTRLRGTPAAERLVAEVGRGRR